jgi:hypothetical protein
MEPAIMTSDGINAENTCGETNATPVLEKVCVEPATPAAGVNARYFLYVVTRAFTGTCRGIFKHLGAAVRCFVKDLVDSYCTGVCTIKWMKYCSASAESYGHNIFRIYAEIKRLGDGIADTFLQDGFLQDNSALH